MNPYNSYTPNGWTCYGCGKWVPANSGTLHVCRRLVTTTIREYDAEGRLVKETVTEETAG